MAAEPHVPPPSPPRPALNLLLRHRGLLIAALVVLAIAAAMGVKAVRGPAVVVAPVISGAIQHSIVVSGRDPECGRTRFA